MSSLTFIVGWLSNLTSRWLADFLVRPSVPLGDAKTDFQPLSITQVTQKIKPFFPFSFLQTENWFFFLQRSNCPLHGDSVFLLKFKLPLQYSHFFMGAFYCLSFKRKYSKCYVSRSRKEIRIIQIRIDIVNLHKLERKLIYLGIKIDSDNFLIFWLV